MNLKKNVQEKPGTKVHTVWFHLQEILEKRNLIYSDRKQIHFSLAPWELTTKEHKQENFKE